MICDLDGDGNGNIDFPEWIALMTNRVSPHDSRAGINRVFNLFDIDRDGYISV